MVESSVKMSKVIVDGVVHEMPTGANLLNELLKLGRPDARYPDQREHGDHYVPHYCYHPGLTVAGNCRMCFVQITTEIKRGDQVQKMTTPATACTNVVRDGMEIDTRSDAVKKLQHGVQEMLLINHPLDCPECDKAGECRLQDYAFDFGRGYSRFEETKSHAHIKQLGPTIDFFGSRCIRCSRCIRFCDEVSQTSELCFVNRGDRTTIDTFPEIPIDNQLDLNTVDLCPVGALKNHDFLYQSRVWSMEEGRSVCNLCAKGCSVRYDSLKGAVKRVTAAENTAVNDWWICNHGRLNFEWMNSEHRLIKPRTKNGAISWTEAYTLAAARLTAHLDRGADALAVVVNCSQTIEELYLMRRLFRELLKADAVAAVARPDQAWEHDFSKFERSSDRNPNRHGVELVFGISDAESSMKDMIRRLESGKVKTLVVVNNSWDAYLPQALVDAARRVEMTIGLGLFDDSFAQNCDLTLAGRTHAEKDGSFINAQWHLQAFRRAVHTTVGEDDGLILQELIDRIDEPQVQSPVLSAAGIFSAATKAIPQLSGYSHRQLHDNGGIRLV